MKVPMAAAAIAGHGVAQRRDVASGILASGIAKIFIVVSRTGTGLPVDILNPRHTMAIPALVPFKKAKIAVIISYSAAYDKIRVVKMMGMPRAITFIRGATEIFQHVALGTALPVPQTRHGHIIGCV